MNKAVDKHIIIKKIQRNKFTSKFMNKKLAADQKKINFWNKKFKVVEHMKTIEYTNI